MNTAKIFTELFQGFGNTVLLFAVTLILLGLTLIFGMVGNGAQRWISIGPITIQPSEIAKLSLILMLAKYFSDNEERITNVRSKKDIFIYENRRLKIDWTVFSLKKK